MRRFRRCAFVSSIALLGCAAGLTGCEGIGDPGAGAEPDFVTEEGNIWSNGVATLGTESSNGDPAIWSWGAQRLDLFYRGTDNSLRHKSNSGASWSAEENLGNTLSSDPAAVSWTSNRIDVFARDSGGQLVQKYYDNGWSGWLTNQGAIVGAPAVASQGYGSLDVFARNTTNQIIVKSYRVATGWSGWTIVNTMGVASDPAAVSWGPNRVDVFARNSSGNLFHCWKGTGLFECETVTASIASAPAVASWGGNRFDVFARNSANNLVRASWVGNGWTPFETLTGAGTFTGAPDAVSWGPNKIDIFFRGSDAKIRTYVWSDNLQVPLIPQKGANWCWAASGQMVSETFGVNGISQCAQANEATGRTDCCTLPLIPLGCDTAGWPDWTYLGFTAAVTPFGEALTVAQVKDQVITKGKPFTWTVAWDGGGGHMMVVVDYLRFADQDWVSVNDPGGVQSLITHAAFVDGPGYSHWRDDYDITYTKNRGDVIVGRSQGNRFRAGRRYQDLFCVDSEQCELGDVNGDGKKDAIVFNRNGRVGVGLSTGLAFGANVAWNTNLCYGSERCRVGDFNGDKKDDILIFKNAGVVVVALSTGTAFSAPVTWHSSFCASTEDCQVADMNGDKRTDLIVFQTNNNVSVSLSSGVAFGATSVWRTGFNYCFNGQVCKTGDVNGDGRADVMGFTMGATNDAFVALSSGTSLGSPAKWHESFGVAGEIVGAVDLDGDNLVDIARTSRSTGLVHAALSNSVAFTGGNSWRWGQGVASPAEEVRYGDVDGDGRADVVTFRR